MKKTILFSGIILGITIIVACGKKPVPPEPVPLPTSPVPVEQLSVEPEPDKAVPTQNPSEPMIVGGDKDEHGCIGSAGYTWCEPKQKCLRVFEETCYATVAEEIQHSLARKHVRPVTEVKVTISKQDGDYVSGGVMFGQGGHGEGGMFLARKSGKMWDVVYDGNGSVDCQKMRLTYKFPDSILKPNFCE